MLLYFNRFVAPDARFQVKNNRKGAPRFAN
jgi:hypothetical protein